MAEILLRIRRERRLAGVLLALLIAIAGAVHCFGGARPAAFEASAEAPARPAR